MLDMLEIEDPEPEGSLVEEDNEATALLEKIKEVGHGFDITHPTNTFTQCEKTFKLTREVRRNVRLFGFLVESSHSRLDVGLIFPNIRYAKIFRPGLLTTKKEHKKLCSILEEWGYEVEHVLNSL